MPNNKAILHPSFVHRIYSVWYRHMRVYTKYIITNSFPPFLEPLIFIFALGIGLGKYVPQMGGIPYMQFLASGLLVTSAMFTAAFECSYDTYIRLEFNKAYDGMLGAPITVVDLLVGEIAWAGTKGAFFATAVLIIISLFGILSPKLYLVVPFIGFFTGIMFAVLSLLVTSFVNDINQFNFYFTGFLSPMFFFSGTVFSIKNLPGGLMYIAKMLPLTRSVNLVRAFCLPELSSKITFDIVYITVFTFVIGFFAIKRLRKKMID